MVRLYLEIFLLEQSSVFRIDREVPNIQDYFLGLS